MQPSPSSPPSIAPERRVTERLSDQHDAQDQHDQPRRLGPTPGIHATGLSAPEAVALPDLAPLDLSWLDPGADGRWMESPDEATRALGRILDGHGTGGAIVTGELGDRRETIESALSGVSPDRAVFRLHGSPFAAATPYGALAILLSGLNEAPPAQIHGMVRALADYLGSPGEQPAIVIVSQADQIDPDTITVLAQLSQINRITLVVHCDRPTEVPVDLAALRRLGTLTGITVWPLTPTASHGLLEEVLGGTVSRFASTVLWQHSSGSVHRLRQLARDCVVSGKLRRIDSSWVLAPGPLPRSTSGGASTAVLRDLPVRQRALLEMLAICGPMRVGDLIHTGFAAELDELDDDRVLEIRNGHSGRLALVTSVQAAEILAAIEPDRHRELASTLEALDPGYLSVLRAAQDLVAIGDAEGAISLFSEVGRASGGRPRASLTTGRVHLAWAESRARAVVGDLDGADAAIRSCPEQSAVLSVQAAALAVARGDLREALACLDVVPAEHRPELLDAGGVFFTSEAIHFRARSIRAEALAMADDQTGALDILTSLDRELTGFRTLGIINDVLSPYERAVIAESMLTVLLSCGQSQRCRELAEAVLAGRHGNPHAVLFADLVIAALDAMTGYRDRAEQRASRAAAQLEVAGQPHDFQLALAIQAFCATDRNDPSGADPSRLLDARVEGHPRAAAAPSLGRLGWLAELFLCWSTGEIHSTRARTARVLALADRAAGEGLYAVEFFAVASAFQWGETWLAPRLAETAAGTQTLTSLPNLLMSRSVLENDPDLLYRSLEQLAAAGYAGHLGRISSPLLKDVPHAQLRRLAETAAASGRRGGAETEDLEGEPEWMAELTRREKEISRLVVAGKSNAMIARISGISIRTVEGHLYQIYAKLQLKGRAELTRLAAAHSPQRTAS
ncbi:LuxR C-terminal-related transcriptional regulator [Citricoccus nitrophenolicus]|uniref:Regulatory LuxR family protein n=1 Tax=Citricoccus muralis TaxID=169134 RepID=A0A3D9L9N4_9MICC|nr:LuxR C-terminal-related transcriptional regulator [Citricoccus muralis]REE02394.1 regulatory LuxR family protein [Citricoccus muralis]